MALGALPDLLAINAELGLVNQGLVECIAAAGKTGIWTSQLDFAGYSHATFTGNWNQALQYYFDELGAPMNISITSTIYGWQVDSKPSWVVVSPTSWASGTKAVTIDPSRNYSTAREGIIIFSQNTTGNVLVFELMQDGQM